MKIVPLDIGNIEAASILADEVFSYVRPSPPSAAFKASLDPDLYDEFREAKNVVRFHYWVAMNTRDNTVLGTTGLYELEEDQDEASWLGWFCVAPAVRGQGIGQKLLSFTMQLATITGNRFLRLYTSTHPKEKQAQFLYEKNNFRIIRIKEKATGRQIFYRERILDHTVFDAAR